MTIRVLLISSRASENVGTIKDHVDALTRDVGDCCIKIDYQELGAHLLLFYDCIIFHYSVVLCMENYFHRNQIERIKKFSGPKIAFIQDEYRFIDATAKAIHDFGISHVFTLVAPDTISTVYHHDFLSDVTFETTLTGYVPTGWTAREVVPFHERTIDVSYRARKLISWLGKHTLQKWQIAERFQQDVERYQFDLNLSVSIREEDRLYGEDWVDLLFNSKAVLGVESGASVCDFDGSIEAGVSSYLANNPNASFDELSDRFFKHVDGVVTQKVISPRCFEAAAARTLMILYPGEYSGILLPGRHYVELAEDHSNVEDVVAILNSPKRAAEIIDRAYQEIALCPKYQQDSFSTRADQVCRELLRERSESFQLRLQLPDSLETAAYKFSVFGYKVINLRTLAVVFSRRILLKAWVHVPQPVRPLIKKLLGRA